MPKTVPEAEVEKVNADCRVATWEGEKGSDGRDVHVGYVGRLRS